MHIDLISKEEYLAERSEWRKDYLRMSADIRLLKQLSKEAASGGFEAANRLQSMRARMSNDAYDMMIDLEDLKDRSRFSVAFERYLETTNNRF